MKEAEMIYLPVLVKELKEDLLSRCAHGTLKVVFEQYNFQFHSSRNTFWIWQLRSGDKSAGLHSNSCKC